MYRALQSRYSTHAMPDWEQWYDTCAILGSWALTKISNYLYIYLYICLCLSVYIPDVCICIYEGHQWYHGASLSREITRSIREQKVECPIIDTTMTREDRGRQTLRLRVGHHVMLAQWNQFTYTTQAQLAWVVQETNREKTKMYRTQFWKES